MNDTLTAFVARELDADVRPEVTAAARAIAARLGGVAVLFYGSVLRTGDLDGLLDFYVLTDGPRHRGLRGLVSRWLWPDISFEEVEMDGRRLRAKVATMPLGTFRRAASGVLMDTTIWVRFAQPSALVWSADHDAARATIDAVAEAARTAARFAAVLGPLNGPPRAFWRALFRETYEAELRVERPGREDQILDYDPQRYAALLRLAWTADGIAWREEGPVLQPIIPAGTCRRIARAWLVRQRLGKLLNAARLVKAAFLLDGAARYAAWKIRRHMGVDLKLTPFREQHPLLAAPGMLWQLWRSPSRLR